MITNKRMIEELEKSLSETDGSNYWIEKSVQVAYRVKELEDKLSKAVETLKLYSEINAKSTETIEELTKQFNSNKYSRKEPSFQDGLYFPHTTRFEVIDDEGRTYVKYDCEVKLAFQDDGQTIKMFVSKNTGDRKNS